MPDATISALGAATTPLTGAEVVPADQSGTTVKVTVAQLTKFAPPPSGDTSGATDAAALNALLTALGTAGGGMLSLQSGIYYVNATIVIPQYCTLRGQGSRVTTVKMANSTNLAAVLAGDTWYNNTNNSGYPIIVESLGVDANTANQSSGTGHCLAFMNFRSIIRRCLFQNARGDGILFTTRSRSGTDINNTAVETQISDNEVFGALGNGINCDNPSGNSTANTDGWMTNNIVDNAGLTGIQLKNAAGWFIGGNHLYGTINLDGIDAYNCYNTRIVANYIENFGNSSSATTYFGLWCGGTPTAGASSLAYNDIKSYELGNASNGYVGLAVQSNTGTCYWVIEGNSVGSASAGTPHMQGIWIYATGSGAGYGTCIGNNVKTGAGILLSSTAAGGANMVISNNSFNYATAAPTTGDWSQGIIVWNSSPSTSGTPSGWMCTATGTPGTWKALLPAVIPVSSHTATGTFGSTLTLGTSKQNTLPYTIFVSVTLVVTSSPTGTNQWGGGVDTSSTPTCDALGPSGTSGTTGCPSTGAWNWSFAVPPGSYLLVKNLGGGTITVASSQVVAFPA